jgi:CheY-like chemotaxis protein
MRTGTEARRSGTGACSYAHARHREPRSVTLLLVEDTAAMCRLIRSLIDTLPVSVVECRQRRDVMPLCRALQPDWVVVDLDLAGGDALAAVREIHQAHPAIRVAVLGEDSSRLRDAAERAGARVYLAKERLVELPRLLRAETP